MKFRYHRGDFEESMKTTVEVATFMDLFNIVKDMFPIRDDFGITFKKYEDLRNDWDNHWVLYNGLVIGTTDGKILN